jgi:hypothetical protein
MTSDAVVALSAVNAVFRSIGRVLVCLDEEFRVVHASESLPHLDPGASIADALGNELFGANGSMRSALEAGERREACRVFMPNGDGLRLLSISAARLERTAVCDSVRYVIVLQPAEDENPADSEAERIRAALESAHWRRAAAAASLNISRTTLWRKMREHGLASATKTS